MTQQDLLKIVNHPDNLSEFEHREDCEEIKRIVDERYGVNITLQECKQAWDVYSSNRDAQWLDVKNVASDEILEAVGFWAKSFFVDVSIE